MIFIVIKIILTSVNVVVLLAGTVQGSVVYAHLCDKSNFCVSRPEYKDFIAVVILSGVSALFWVSRQYHN